MRKFVYKSEVYKRPNMGGRMFAEWLSKLGAEGWELVYTQETAVKWLGVADRERVCVFKKEIFDNEA